MNQILIYPMIFAIGLATGGVMAEFGIVNECNKNQKAVMFFHDTLKCEAKK